MIAKGQIHGVMQMFSRQRAQLDHEEMEFVEALATQAAIAVDNARLFHGLQQANFELSMAYNATIEGWSHALDERFKEVEGHTERVTEWTVQLARAANLEDKAIGHIRRGAILHDIGNMGIPDSLLQKTSELTDEEMEIVRGHPEFGYKMLERVNFLQPALEIVRCHHEKWDGTGYPRGLHGEQIPLAARIFSIVDVWDALTSGRPHRPAWPKKKAFAYIRSESGKHFDPELVDIFLQLVDKPEKGGL
jgi:HD-GYP domain-containing protein (c-di-GMP phosphodiesterase class II)